MNFCLHHINYLVLILIYRQNNFRYDQSPVILYILGLLQHIYVNKMVVLYIY